MIKKELQNTCVVELLNSSKKLYADQRQKIQYLEQELGVPFVENILKCIRQRVTELDQESLNEYLWHIYHGIENRTGISLWLFDNNLCQKHFKPEIPGKPCLLWVTDILKSASKNINNLTFPLNKENSQLLLRVYDSGYLN
jgi:hypothetical protein